MSTGQFDVERATAGLVMALFVSAALLLAGLLYFVLRDIDKRTESSEGPQQAVRVEKGTPPPSTRPFLPIPHRLS
ncbi:MAG TPA: hypothetical protein VJ884_09960 [Salinibacter sp.]|nr:hypothetical protein [Salinibacter sp.]